MTDTRRMPDAEVSASLLARLVVQSGRVLDVPFGEVVAAAEMVGGVLSMLTVTTLLGSLTLPALSDTVCAVEETAVPSSLSDSFPGQSPSTIPDRPSAQVKCTVTSFLYQPWPLGDEVAAAEMDGLVWSTLTL